MQHKEEKASTLIELNDELENYFHNTIIPQLFVDANLILRKFTPPALKQFKLKLVDVGVPIEDIYSRACRNINTYVVFLTN